MRARRVEDGADPVGGDLLRREDLADRARLDDPGEHGDEGALAQHRDADGEGVPATWARGDRSDGRPTRAPHRLEALGLDQVGQGRARRRREIHHPPSRRGEQGDGDPAPLPRQHPAGIFLEHREIAPLEASRRGQGLQRRHRRAQLSIDGIHQRAGRLDAPALDHRPLLPIEGDHGDGRECDHRQEDGQREHQKVRADLHARGLILSAIVAPVSVSARATAGFTSRELRSLRALRTPYGVQRALDAMPYHHAGTAWSPRRVLRARTAHCLEGAVFAAAALRVLGFPPLLLDLEAVQDTDHVLAVYPGARPLGRDRQVQLRRAALPRAGVSQPCASWS